jgi:hypothetical protein
MRGCLLSLGLAALLAVGAAGVAHAAGGEGPISIPMPETELGVDDGFTPKALSKTEPTPIAWLAAAEIKEFDGAHPPALRELAMELDRAIEVHMEGIPTCPRKRLGETVETAAALEACRPALIGEGEVTVQLSYPESDPVNLRSKLLLFNGGERGGATKLLIHAYFANLISSSVVIPVAFARRPDGHFGTRAVARIPWMAEGHGSITKFDFRTFKTVEVDGARVHPISATCPEGKLRVHNRGEFIDGVKEDAETVRACTETS